MLENTHSAERYDVFVSYSHLDEEWVKRELLPRLDSWEISVCIDRRHFVAGQPVDAELRRLVQSSRQGLLVLSSNWIASNFTDYELQLMLSTVREDYEGFVPLRIDRCAIPPALQQFQIIDSEQFGWESTWIVLQHALFRSKIGPSQKRLAAELMLRKIPSPGEFYGYSYLCQPLVANINPEECRFDSINIEFDVNDYDNEFHGRLRAVRMNRSSEGFSVYFSYHGSDYFAGLRRITSVENRKHPVVISLGPFLGRPLPNNRFERSAVSVPGKKVVRMFLDLRLNNQPVTERCVGALPPVLRLPDFRASEGFTLHMTSEQFLPTSSGLLDGRLRRSIFRTAAENSSDSLLVEMAPRVITRHELTSRNGTDFFYSCDDWAFIFYSKQNAGFFSIHSTAPTTIQNFSDQTSWPPPTSWLDERMLSQCKIDCDTAYLMALTIAASPESQEPGLGLEAFKMPDGLWRPIWKLPFRLRNLPVGILADTCEVLTLSDGTWMKPEGIIWNTY